MDDIKIKRGSVANFDRFYDFFQKSLEELFISYSEMSISFLLEIENEKKAIRKQIEEQKKFFFEAEANRKILGFLLVSKPMGGVMFGNWLAVDRDYQNKGIASRLLKLWEKYALGVGVHAIWLWTTENNQQFYQNRGFSLAGKFPKAWFGFDHYLFYRLLRHPEEKNYLKEYLASKKAS